ncbi:HAD-IA family hydrolase [Natrialba sp. INN-245]|uniref:HAD family hydrolase n=1 Tax=Natrialba sp. INN-245 TaxID=2690967 RepID=UPI001310949A|nr:HAD-IA family hydrolase [Natrialba sp. INN-245]
MTEYDAVVYDLDGTIVDLNVDWNAVATDVLTVYDAADVEPRGNDLWELLLGADEVGLAAAVESVIASHEREGAPTSPRLRHADELLERTVPVGVCSLNCEEACRIALEEQDLHDEVETVVGRDTVETQKPEPEPLLAAVDDLETSPERALFVGDSPRDELTAERAGTAFEYV